MKVYIDAKQDPWVTWDKELWKEAQKHKTPDFEITTNPNDADVILIEWSENVAFRLDNETNYLIFIGNEEEAKEAYVATNPVGKNVRFLTDSIDVLKEFERFGVPITRWNLPSRVSKIDPIDPAKKTGGFVITSNGQRAEDNLTEILRTYFAICLQDSKTKEGELDLLHDVEIFSAQELPFETFNNVTFHGLQPNPKMFKMIRNARLFISPYNGAGVPMNAVDAWMLGTPAIVRDTKVNRSVFNWTDKCFYKDEKELAQKIKFFSEIPTDDPDYVRMVEDGFNAVKGTHYVTNSLLDLIYILQG